MFVFLCFVVYAIIAGLYGIEEDTILQGIMKDITELKTRQNKCDCQAAKVSELEEAVAALQKSNAQLEHEILEVRKSKNPSKENQSFDGYLDNITSNHNKYKRIAISGQVAFSVGVSTFDLTNLGDHHTIIFDKQVTNVGNAYSATTGIFQAPLKGIYAFTLTLMVNPRHSEYLEIVVDGNNLNDIFADASSVDDNVSTTKQWILDLNAGSEVWVRTTSYFNNGEIHGNMHTAFSGFLLFETE